MNNEIFLPREILDSFKPRDREYELMDNILTIVIESSSIDGKIDLSKLIEKRHNIRMKMFKEDNENEYEFDHEDYLSFKGLLTRVVSLELIISKMLQENNNE